MRIKQQEAIITSICASCLSLTVNVTGVMIVGGNLKNRVGIDDRALVVNLQNRISDWEGGKIMGKNRKSALLTLV